VRRASRLKETHKTAAEDKYEAKNAHPQKTFFE